MKRSIGCLFALMSALLFSVTTRAEDAPKDRNIEAGEFTLTAPEGWKREKPANKIIEQEFSVPAADGDKAPGRITMMFSGGSLDDNINRWKGQFKQLDKAKDVEKHKIADLDLHVVDLTGTFGDKGANLEGYRMLAAIIEMGRSNYFVKFVGPKNTVEEHEESFKKLLDSLKKAK